VHVFSANRIELSVAIASTGAVVATARLTVARQIDKQLGDYAVLHFSNC
jgi:hypothetical protein